MFSLLNVVSLLYIVYLTKKNPHILRLALRPEKTIALYYALNFKTHCSLKLVNSMQIAKVSLVIGMRSFSHQLIIINLLHFLNFVGMLWHVAVPQLLM